MMLFRNILTNPLEGNISDSFEREKPNPEDCGTTIIHPDDPTTAFLTEIYDERPAVGKIERKEVYRSKIQLGERTLLLGHGFPQGLVGGGKIVIDDSFADLFEGQPNNVYVFCNADCYVWRNRLRGFATGMFISEPIEAQIFNVDATPQEINDSNVLFSRLMRQSIDLKPREILEHMKTHYHITGNAAVEYNRNGFRVFE